MLIKKAVVYYRQPLSILNTNLCQINYLLTFDQCGLV